MYIEKNEIVEILVERKNKLVNELDLILQCLKEYKADLNCDNKIRKAINSHPALDLK